MLCPQCGSAVSQEATECPNCHASLVKTRRKVELSSKGLQRYTQKLRAVSPADRRIFPEKVRVGDRYELGEMLGRGPLGQVFMALDTEIDVPVVLKVFVSDFDVESASTRRFDTTLKQARKRTHKHLLRVNDHGQHEGHYWVAMQHLEGLSLSKLIKLREGKDERFAADEIDRILSQVLSALKALPANAPHGNLKPDNVIFLPDTLKVTDYFVYQALGVERVAPLQDANNLFLAPEVRDAKAVTSSSLTTRADVYSLGALVAALAFGQSALEQIQTFDASGLTHASLLALCQDALAKNPDDRPASIAAFEARLWRALRPESSPMAGLKAGGVAPPPPPTLDASEVSDASLDENGGEESDEEVDAIEEDGEALDMSAALGGVGLDHGGSDPLSEDEIATIEADRVLGKPELGDLLPTNEVDRAKIPIKTKPELAQSASTSALIDKNKVAPSSSSPQKKEQGTFPVGYLLLAAFGIIVLALIVHSFNKPKEVVEIGNEPDEVARKEDRPVVNDAAKTAPVTPTAIEPVSSTPSVAALAALEQAEDVVQNQAMPQAVAEVAKVQESESLQQDMGVQGGVQGEEVAAAITPTTTPPAAAVTKPVESGPTKPAAQKKEEAAADKTSCPQGMVLVKSKDGPNACIDRYEYPGKGKPKTRVTWFEAKKSCESSGKRLCARSEWSRACGGKYPWKGKEWDANKCNTTDEDDFERSLASVGSFKSCRSYTGAYDMVGNAFEWVAEKRIVGGSHNSGEGLAACGYSSAKSPSSSASDIGFRCCADPN